MLTPWVQLQSRYHLCGVAASVLAKLFTHAVDEKLNATAAGAHVDVEVLPVLEELAELAENAPAGALVKFLRAHVLQAGSAARALHRVGFGHTSLRKRRYWPRLVRTAEFTRHHEDCRVKEQEGCRRQESEIYNLD